LPPGNKARLLSKNTPGITYRTKSSEVKCDSSHQSTPMKQLNGFYLILLHADRFLIVQTMQTCSAKIPSNEAYFG